MVGTKKNNTDSKLMYFELNVITSASTSLGTELAWPDGVCGVMLVYDSLASAIKHGCYVDNLHVLTEEQEGYHE